MNTPPTFDESFLRWFKARTEDAWTGGIPRRRWLPGLSEGEIAGIEREWDIGFPPDYRLFLRMLHAIGEATAGVGQSRWRLMPVKKSGIIFNWQLDKKRRRKNRQGGQIHLRQPGCLAHFRAIELS